MWIAVCIILLVLFLANKKQRRPECILVLDNKFADKYGDLL